MIFTGVTQPCITISLSPKFFSLLCFLGAVTLVVLDVLVPDESRSSRNPQGAEPAGSSPSLLSLLDIPVTTGLNTLGGIPSPSNSPRLLWGTFLGYRATGGIVESTSGCPISRRQP